MKISKIVGVVLALLLTVTALAACGEAEKMPSGSETASAASSETSASTESVSSENDASSDMSVSSDAGTSSLQSSAAASSERPTSSAVTSSETETGDRFEKTATVGGKGVIYKFNDQIYKLEVPFSGIYTSVFFVLLDNGSSVIVDTGSNADDVANYVIPAAKKLNIDLGKVKGILLTHTHGDHAGGLSALAPQCPNATVYGVNSNNSNTNGSAYRQVSDGAQLMNHIKVVTIKGHDTDACGYLDTRSNTLISGDSLQLHGIASWGCQVRDPDAYFASMKKLQGMTIENILISHAYCPSGAYAIGAAESQKYIQDSIDCLDTLKQFTVDLYQSGVTDPAEIQSLYVELMRETYADFPKAGFDVAIKAIIRAYC